MMLPVRSHPLLTLTSATIVLGSLGTPASAFGSDIDHDVSRLWADRGDIVVSTGSIADDDWTPSINGGETEREKASILLDFGTRLIEHSIDIDPEIARIVDENLWEII